jgi:DHA1 family multidrug resistance protein-like MFS transporter
MTITQSLIREIAFTTRVDIHWIVGLIGVTMATASIYLTTQCIFLYVPFCYPQFAASLLAANALSRSVFAVAAILYAPFMFQAMGVSGGVGFLAGLTILCCLGLNFLYFFGGKLRAKSRFAIKP